MDELQETFNGPPVVEQQLEQIEETTEEIEDLSEQLALASIINEERHEEILECLNRLEQSSTTENPSLAAIQQELLSLRTELVNLRSSMAMSHSSQIPSESTPETPDEQNPGRLTEEPGLAEVPEPVKPKKKSRFI